MKLALKLVEQNLCIASLPQGAAIIVPASGFYSFTRTHDETTLVCGADHLPNDCLQVNRDWSGFQVQGPLDFSLTGIIAALSSVLAEAGISLYAVSTFDTDWILVKSDKAQAAAEAWKTAGHDIG